MPDLAINELGQVNVSDFYEPQPKQDLLHTNPGKNLLAIGGGGSGKSFFLLGEAIYVCFQFPGAHCLLLRRDFPELERGLIQDFKDTVPKELYKFNDSKHIATFLNGSKIFFGNLENQSEKSLSKYLSSAFVWIGIDELGQFSYEAWMFLSWRNRINKGCQADVEGNMPIPRMGGATNPLGPGYGFIKSMWVDHKPVLQLGQTVKKHDGKYYQNVHGKDEVVFDPHDYVYVHSTILDNPAQMAKDPDYISKLMRLPPALRQKALYGDLNAVAGAYYQNFQYDRHILSLPRDHEKIKWEPWQPVWLGIDWGLAHHSAIYWFTRAKVLGLEGWKNKIVAYREMLVNEKDYDELCDLIYEKMKPPEEGEPPPMIENEVTRCKFIFLSPERFARSGDKDVGKTIGVQMGQHLHDLGLPFATPANNRRVDGAVFIYNLLESGDIVFIEEACPHLIAALQIVIRDENNLEDVLKTETIEDDCYDGFRYGALSMLSEKGKPIEIQQQEKLSTITDPTARMMLAYKYKMEREKRAKRHKPRFIPRWMRQ
jgi:hypothetical protein